MHSSCRAASSTSADSWPLLLLAPLDEYLRSTAAALTPPRELFRTRSPGARLLLLPLLAPFLQTAAPAPAAPSPLPAQATAAPLAAAAAAAALATCIRCTSMPIWRPMSSASVEYSSLRLALVLLLLTLLILARLGSCKPGASGGCSCATAPVSSALPRIRRGGEVSVLVPTGVFRRRSSGEPYSRSSTRRFMMHFRCLPGGRSHWRHRSFSCSTCCTVHRCWMI